VSPRIIVDTGALYALADRNDRWHRRLTSFLESESADLVVPITVLPEACYLIQGHLGPEAERRLVASCASGELAVEPVTTEDFRRAVQFLEIYADARLGFVDSSVAAVAERLRVRQILTTDRRHFSLFRPRHCPAFELLP
jgi:predicted nucleic acid-binding protein